MQDQSFNHYPQLGSTGESCSIDRLVNWELCLLIQLPLCHNGKAGITSALLQMQRGSNVSLLLHSAHTCEQDPEILTLLHFGEWLSGNLKWPIHPFTSTMASDLDVICKKQGWNPQDPELDTIHHPTAHRNPVHSVINKFIDKGEPWHPTLTLNESDLLPAIRTKLSLRVYRDWTTCGNEPLYTTLHILPEKPLQDTSRDTVITFFQIHKTHVDWLG